MDIMIHIFLLIVIGLFFFIDKFSKTNNPMFIVILLCFCGFLLTQTGSIEIVDYNTIERVGNTYSHPSTDITSDGLGILTVQAFWVLVYWFFMIVSVVNIVIGDKNE